MSAYLVIKARVTEHERFAAYAQGAAQLLEQFGGRYVVMGGRQEQLEGEADGMRVVVSRFADREAALAFWNSEQYAALKARRAGTGVFDVRLVEGAA